MKKDLLQIYVKNHLSVFYLPVLVAIIFLWGRSYLNGYPPFEELKMAALLLGTSAIFFIRQRFLYNRILASHDDEHQSESKFVLVLILNKLGYILPWLLIVFWPFKTDYVFDHILGFVFVFLSIGAYVALSTSHKKLFLFDIGVPVIAACIILFVNKGSIEIPYISSGLLLFTAYAVFIGNKLHKSSIDLVTTNAQLARAAAEAKDANMAKSDFLSMISHEIRTPMHGIISTVEHLYESDLDKDQHKSLQVITRCSDTLLAMLNDVLDISKIEAKKVEIDNIDFNVHDLTKDISEIVQYSAQEKDIELKTSIDQSVPQFIRADKVKIQQILINFLNNAIKFTEEGSVTLEAKITNNGQDIYFSVTDTGIGISDENKEKLFDRFVQADISVTRRFGGTGLGLSISKAFVELMDGSIGVDSEKGKGSTFWFHIPLVVSSADSLVQDVKVKSDVSIRGTAILVAEDNTINQKSVERILIQAGCKVVMVENGQQLLEEVEKDSFDLILMDMNMPVLDGIMATKELKNHDNKKIRNIPVVGLTAATEDRMLSAFYDSGIVDHISKPFKKKDLIKILAKNLGIDSITTKDSGHTSKTIRSKLNEIKEDFGVEFFNSFVKDSLDEIERLHRLIKDMAGKKDYKALSSYAHDLCAVAGNIGMKESYEVAKVLEQAGLEEKSMEISNWLNLLEKSVDQELQAVKQELSSL